MKFSSTLLLQALASLVIAEPAKVYIIGDFDDRPSSSQYPILSPEVARLVIAQRLDVSSYHNLEHVNEATLEYINIFGNRRQALFSDVHDEEPPQLVFMVDGVTEDTIEKAFGGMKPDFAISNPPSSKANKQFVKDIQTQITAVLDPFKSGGIVSYDLTQTMDHLSPADALADIIRSHREIYPTLVVIVFPESAYKAKHAPSPYGTYELPSILSRRQEQAEEPIVDASSPSNIVVPGIAYSPAESTAAKLPKVVPMCFSSMDSCTSSTNNCSGHGACYQKYGSNGGNCFACGCIPTINSTESRIRTTHWGGGACSKIDVSSPFWLISGFTIVMVSLISWAIGMLFSIGEEKLPGVIGAGVSGVKAR